MVRFARLICGAVSGASTAPVRPEPGPGGIAAAPAPRRREYRRACRGARPPHAEIPRIAGGSLRCSAADHIAVPSSLGPANIPVRDSQVPAAEARRAVRHSDQVAVVVADIADATRDIERGERLLASMRSAADRG